jgi:hypothetical protein
MKKALLLVPAAGLLLVLGAFVWHRGFRPIAAPPAPPPAPPAARLEAHGYGEHLHLDASPAFPPGTPGGSLLLRVTGRSSPVPDARITLMRAGEEARMSVRTGADGAFLVLQIPPGTYVASVQHPRFLPGEFQVSVAPGLRTTSDFDLKTGARVFGRITDAAGSPLAGSSALPIDATSLMPFGPHMGATADADGRYELPPLMPGAYGIRFRHPRYRIRDHLGLQIRSTGEEIEVNAALDDGQRIQGRVVDEQGVPLSKARVLFGNGGSGGVTETDADGRFIIYGLTEEPCGGSASLKGYGTAYRRGVAPGAKDVEFRLSKGGALAGRVMAEPMPEQFVVMLSKYEPELGRPLRIQTKAFTQPPGGAFEVEDLGSGMWTVEVESPDYDCLDRPEVTVSPGQTSGGLLIRLRKK